MSYWPPRGFRWLIWRLGFAMEHIGTWLESRGYRLTFWGSRKANESTEGQYREER